MLALVKVRSLAFNLILGLSQEAAMMIFNDDVHLASAMPGRTAFRALGKDSFILAPKSPSYRDRK
jgi:hypothetical protein